MKALMIAAVVMLGGCAGGYYSDIPPTIATVEAAGGVQIYKGTAYLPSDLKPSGELRAFGDYDFMVESAPCTVLPIYRSGDEWFVVNGDQHWCRDRNVPESTSQYRLVRLGSAEDCRTRTWDMRASLFPGVREMGRLCNYDRTPNTKSR